MALLRTAAALAAYMPADLATRRVHAMRIFGSDGVLSLAEAPAPLTEVVRQLRRTNEHLSEANVARSERKTRG